MLRMIALCFLMQTGTPNPALVDPYESGLGVPIGELTDIEGVRANTIQGPGLVVGLNGTGDQSQGTRRLIATMLTKRNSNLSARDINAKNTALVWVTAELPPFAENGTRIQVTVSSVSDATSIVGGTLLESQLEGSDGVVYALAQGAVIVGGFSASGQGASVQTNHTTVGIVPSGGIVEEVVPMRPVDGQGRVTLMLRQPEFTTSMRIAEVINERYPGSASMIDAGTVRLVIPAVSLDAGREVAFISDVQRMQVQPRIPARVVINERTGTIIVGHGVRIEPVAITHGDLTFTIEERPEASQPAPWSDGTTEVLPRTQVTTEEDVANMIVLDPGVSISRIAHSLDALGATPREMISLFVALKEHGALHAELVRQ